MITQPCRAGCGVTIMMAQYPKTGKWNPLEVEPVPEGNILVDLATQTYRILTGDELAVAHAAGELLYRSHFAECPERERFRR